VRVKRVERATPARGVTARLPLRGGTLTRMITCEGGGGQAGQIVGLDWEMIPYIIIISITSTSSSSSSSSTSSSPPTRLSRAVKGLA
jgi:hypothetical protein